MTNKCDIPPGSKVELRDGLQLQLSPEDNCRLVQVQMVRGALNHYSAMKFGLRIPSLKKRIAARTSVKRFVRHNLGLKAPRGWGWLTNPKRALYNRIYNRTTKGCLVLVLGSAAAAFCISILPLLQPTDPAMNRRLPVYLLIDCSESMIGGGIEAVRSGLTMPCLTKLRSDPHALDTVHLSVITFDAEARVAVPMTSLLDFQEPDLPSDRAHRSELRSHCSPIASKQKSAKPLTTRKATTAHWCYFSPMASPATTGNSA
jgi:hypothetical protein